MVDPANQLRNPLVPAPDDQVDPGILGVGPDSANRADRHQQVADPLEPQEKNGTRTSLRFPPVEQPQQMKGRREHSIRKADGPAVARVSQLEVAVQGRAIVLRRE